MAPKIPIRGRPEEDGMKRFYTPAVLTTIVVVVNVLGAPGKWW
jgi:hypothetical protein